MSSFDIATLHPKARRLYEHWCTIDAPHGLPIRRGFDPTLNPDLLPNIKLVDVHRDPLRLRYRVVGTGIEGVLLRGVGAEWLDVVYAGHPHWPRLLGDYRFVIEQRVPFWRRGDPHVVADPACAMVETLRLPLSIDGRQVDMVLGLTLCFDAAGRELQRDRMRPG